MGRVDEPGVGYGTLSTLSVLEEASEIGMDAAGYRDGWVGDFGVA